MKKGLATPSFYDCLSMRQPMMDSNQTALERLLDILEEAETIVGGLGQESTAPSDEKETSISHIEPSTKGTTRKSAMR